MWQTRREFLKTTAAGGATMLVSRLLPAGLPPGEAGAAVMAPPGSWSGAPGKAHYRIDGLAKVTGQKIYARDFNPADMPGWPTEYQYALVLCAPFVDHVFDGVNLDDLPREGRPQVVVTGDDLERDKIGIAEEEYPAGKYLVKKGARPDYLGKPVAILLFDEHSAFVQARKILVYRGKGIRRGEKVSVPEATYYPNTSIIHVEEAKGGQVFAQVQGGPVHPEQGGDRNEEAMAYVNKITELFKTRNWDLYSHTYTTQMVDPMFMEPENGLAWFNRKTKTVEFLVGSQSPGYDVNGVREVLKPSTLGVDDAHVYCAYPGGGFGGRDTSILCLYLGIAAAYAEKPIRILHDRFQQFQQGVKRHASTIDLTLALDGKGKFHAVRNYTLLNGGGRINVSKYVGDVAGINGAGPYAFRWADIWSRPQHTTSLVAGSMRGFGALQSTFALESLIDEIAIARDVDPIDLRIQNVLTTDQSIVTGAPIAPPGMPEMLNKAKNHDLWRGREDAHGKAKEGDYAYGVGVALAMKNYGSGADAANAAIEIKPDGKIVLTTSAVDMGQGLATALAVSTAESLGKNADEIDTGVVGAFNALQQVEGFIMQPGNPRWTPIIQNSTKAASGSSRWVHPVEQVSQLMFESGVIPAARSIWGEQASQLNQSALRWENERLAADGFQPIPFEELARAMHDQKRVVSAMAHGFFSGRWISAEYTVDGLTKRWGIDGLAVKRGDSDSWELLDRSNPKLFTVKSMWEENGQSMGATAAVVAVQVHRKTGEPRVVGGLHLAAPGRMIVPDLVEGQMDGSWAMGIGQALLEDLPAYVQGGASGKWNLNRYHVALARDCAIHDVEKIILPPESDDAPARGMGEVALNCVPPAVANAVAHATGKRFRDLPITAEKIRAVWS
ncbi:MAG: molybdopterin-dependent oxidoreductase [Candidatus Binatia bacterium]|nr:molybdopterin-dependent oxidoreductase [Candidatus Binatia bacterium]